MIGSNQTEIVSCILFHVCLLRMVSGFVGIHYGGHTNLCHVQSIQMLSQIVGTRSFSKFSVHAVTFSRLMMKLII